MQDKINKDNWMDRMSITATSLCAVHCIFLPVLLPVLPLLGLSVVAEDTFEHIVLLITLVMGFIALFAGFHKYHRKLYPFYSLALGGIVYASKHEVSESVQPYFIVVGASLIIFAHILNIRLCRSCKSC